MNPWMRSATGLLAALLCLQLSVSPGFGQEKAPSLGGTYWRLLSLTEKGEKITDADNPADVEFLKDGKWGILHYGGRREAGTYEVKNDRLIMKTEDGEIYQNAKMTWKPADKLLELDSGKYLMRLRAHKPK
jgi:hypothetical protein